MTFVVFAKSVIVENTSIAGYLDIGRKFCYHMTGITGIPQQCGFSTVQELVLSNLFFVSVS